MHGQAADRRNSGRTWWSRTAPAAPASSWSIRCCRRPADGYTIAANTISLAALFSETTAQFKPDDLQMVARSQVDPYGLIVHASTPFKTIDEFVAFARKKPGIPQCRRPVCRSVAHRVAWEVFSDIAEVQDDLGAVSGRRSGADGGRRRARRCRGDQSRATSSRSSMPARCGCWRCLRTKRLEDFPDVPTYKESGWNVVRYQWRGIMVQGGNAEAGAGPAGSPRSRKRSRREEWKTYLRAGDAARRLSGAGRVPRAAAAGHQGNRRGEEEAGTLNIHCSMKITAENRRVK